MKTQAFMGIVIQGCVLPLTLAFAAPASVRAASGKAAGEAPTSTGTRRSELVFPAGDTQRVAWHDAYAVVPLPGGHHPLSLADDGVVLLQPANSSGPETWVRWVRGQLSAPLNTHAAVAWALPSMNGRGDILGQFFGSGGDANPSYALLGVDGRFTALDHLFQGPFGIAEIDRLSNGHALGTMVLDITEEAESESGVGSVTAAFGAWQLGSGAFTERVRTTGRFQPDPVGRPFAINNDGDYLADFSTLGEDGAWQPLIFLNGVDAGLNALSLNNRQAMIGWDYATWLPAYRKGTELHDLGDRFGWPISLNDHDEILVEQDDGRPLLWQKAVDGDGGAAFAPTDLGDLTGLDIAGLVQINNTGEILLSAWDEGFETQPYLLMPARLEVDFNRDGSIDTSRSPDNPDRELARRQLPWYFWVNDDDDSGETSGTDIPGKGSNGTDAVVNGIRDLVDFFPVHLGIGALLQLYPADDPATTYKLAQADGAANFVTTDLTPQTAGAYHRDVGQARILGKASVTQITAAGVPLDRAFLGKILGGQKGIILVEARKPTQAPLRLEVWHGGTRVAVVELPLSFAGVETMFRHVNLAGAVGINPEFHSRGGAANWPDLLNNKQAFVFVHGYNVNQKQARGWQAEFFKRMWWSGSRAEFWSVTWYGTDSQKSIGAVHVTTNYQANVIHAFGTAPVLADFISELRGMDGFEKINIAGHSLGNMVVSSAISDYNAPVDRYFMLDAAVAAEAYDGAGDSRVLQPDDATASLPHTEWNRDRGGVYPPKLWATNWHHLFAADDGRSFLTWHDRLVSKRDVAYYNFYSTGEEVLDYDAAHTPPVAEIVAQIGINKLGEFLHIALPLADGQPPGHKAWQFQEQLKGRNITNKFGGSTYGGWGFNTFNFTKRVGGYGKGPVLIPAALLPNDITESMLSGVFTGEALREEPFFRPGGDRTKVGSWQYVAATKTNSWQVDRLARLYDATTGSSFAFTHRNNLLARMIPAMSPPAGKIPVLKLGPTNQRNFDMNGVFIRPVSPGANTQPWPSGRSSTDWWHSDVREVAYPYVRKLYTEIVKAANLTESIP